MTNISFFCFGYVFEYTAKSFFCNPGNSKKAIKNPLEENRLLDRAGVRRFAPKIACEAPPQVVFFTKKMRQEQ